jgi:hypothetical protein
MCIPSLTVYFSDVSCETTRVLISRVTQVASVAVSLGTVRTQMNGEPRWLRKRPRALIAFEWFLACVRPQMAHQIRLLLKGGGTVGALLFFFTASRDVTFERTQEYVFVSAGWAHKLLWRVLIHSHSLTALFCAIVNPVTQTEIFAAGAVHTGHIYWCGEATRNCTQSTFQWTGSREVPPAITDPVRSGFPVKLISHVLLCPCRRD